MTQSQVDSLRGLKMTATICKMSDRHQIAPYPIRLSPELRERLEVAAKAGGRSLHAEIVGRLSLSFDEQRPPDAGRYLASMVDRYEADVAMAEVEKHTLHLMLIQVVMEHRSMAALLQKHAETPPEAKQTFEEWAAEAKALLDEADEKMSMPFDEAIKRFNDATERLIKGSQLRREEAEKTLAEARALAARASQEVPDLSALDKPF